MDPGVLTQAEWNEIPKAIIFLWVFVFFMVSAAFSFLLGHGVIPSLIASRHISRSVQRIRPLFYLAALGAISSAVFLIANAISTMKVIGNFWTRWFI